MESTLCWKHFLGFDISWIFPALSSHLPLHCAFPLIFSCVHAPIRSLFFASCLHPIPCAGNILFLLFDWWKFVAFHASARTLWRQSCIFWSRLFHMVCSPFFSAVSSLPISHVCVFWGACCPKQSRLCHLAHGAKESRVRRTLPAHKPNKHPMWTVPKSPKKSRPLQNQVLLHRQPWEGWGTEAQLTGINMHPEVQKLQAGQLPALLVACSSVRCNEASKALILPWSLSSLKDALSLWFTLHFVESFWATDSHVLGEQAVCVWLFLIPPEILLRTFFHTRQKCTCHSPMPSCVHSLLATVGKSTYHTNSTGEITVSQEVKRNLVLIKHCGFTVPCHFVVSLAREQGRRFTFCSPFCCTWLPAKLVTSC